MATLQKLWRGILRDKRGQDMTEYALIAGLLSTVTLAIVPEMLVVTGHLGDILKGVAQTIVELAELK
jgi:Flp pilus assembly pilin Flp